MIIDFLPEIHQYKIDGVRVPSVSEILKAAGIIPDFNSPAAEYKRQLGTLVHLSVKMYFENTLDYDSIDGEVKKYFDGFLKFHKQFPVNPLEVEKALGSSQGFAGTPDFFTENTLYDLKCSKTVYPHYSLQMGGYTVLLNENRYKPQETILIHLLPDDFKLTTMKPDIFGFKQCLKKYKEINNGHGNQRVQTEDCFVA